MRAQANKLRTSVFYFSGDCCDEFSQSMNDRRCLSSRLSKKERKALLEHSNLLRKLEKENEILMNVVLQANAIIEEESKAGKSDAVGVDAR